MSFLELARRMRAEAPAPEPVAMPLPTPAPEAAPLAPPAPRDLPEAPTPSAEPVILSADDLAPNELRP